MITPKLPVSTSAVNKRDPQTYALIGAAMAVHGEHGHGFLETVFQESFEIELQLQGIPFLREHPFQLQYKGRPLKTSYRCDFFCFGEAIVEIKAITDVEVAQLINYLKASKMKRGLLLNFGAPSLEHKRIVLDLPESPLNTPINLRKSA